MYGYKCSLNWNINYHYFISLGPFRPCLFRTCYDNSNPFRSCTKIFQSIEIKIVENPAIDPGSDHPIEKCEWDEVIAGIWINRSNLTFVGIWINEATTLFLYLKEDNFLGENWFYISSVDEDHIETGRLKC